MTVVVVPVWAEMLLVAGALLEVGTIPVSLCNSALDSAVEFACLSPSGTVRVTAGVPSCVGPCVGGLVDLLVL